MIYITTRSLSEGRRSGLASALGVEIGTLAHVAAAAAGLSALVASSAATFSLIKYAGAAYLLYLGIRALLGAAAPDGARPGAEPVSTADAFSQGLLVQVLNPKVAIFFLALMPQFVDPATGPVALQILVLGGLMAVLGLAIDCLYALGASAIGARLRACTRAASRRRRVTGTVYIALGAAAALSGDRRGG